MYLRASLVTTHIVISTNSIIYYYVCLKLRVPHNVSNLVSCRLIINIIKGNDGHHKSTRL